MKTTLRKALPMLLCLILCIYFIPAAWAESTYTIRFDANGGYGEMYAITFNEGETGVLDPNNFSRANYVFSHWNTKADGSGISYPDQGDITPTDSITLYAQWVKTFYSVNYNKNGGGGVMPSGSVQKYRSGTVKECAFNPPTYYMVFTEWNTSPDGTGTSYRPGDPIWSDDIPNDITLYAIWREKLNVRFYPGEGSGTATSVEEPKGSEVRLPTPTSFGFTAPDGQTFAGWMIDGEYRLYKAGEYYAFDSAKMVTAIWTNSIRLSYDPNGGTLRTSAGTFSTARSWTIPKDTEITLYTADELKLTRSGYEFKGWALSPSARSPKYFDGEAIFEGFTRDTSLYAMWEQKGFIGTVIISGSTSGSGDVGYMGEILTVDITGDKSFEVDHYQWYRDGVAISGATGSAYPPTADDFNTAIACDVWFKNAEGNPYHSVNSKFIFVESGEKNIVNNGQTEADYVYGLYDGMYYTVNDGVRQKVTLTTAGFPVTQKGVYEFYTDEASNSPVATVDVVNWWTIGYSTSSETTTGFGTGSGTVTMRRGSTTMTGSTTIRDSATGEILLRPYYGVSGYANQWLVRDGCGITDVTLNIRLSSGSYSRVSRNGGEPSSTNAEQTISLGMINEPEMYNIVFSRTDLSVPVAPIDAEHFPDPVFRRYVQARDTDNDGMLSNIEINRVISMSCSNLGISSLKGIELFDKLETLFCQSNDVSELDVSACTSLKELFCSDNYLTKLTLNRGIIVLDCSNNLLTALDLSDCSQLQTLNCARNDLTELDVRSCNALTSLDCYKNQLTTLDLTYNSLLRNLNCYDNLLGSLSLNNNHALTSLDCCRNLLTTLTFNSSASLTSLRCYGNLLTSLDMSGFSKLRTLECYGNNLSELTLGGCNSLATLSCEKNALSELDVSACTNLRRLNCSQNHLMSLDLSDYTLLTTLSCENNDLLFLRVTGCPALKALTCQRNALSELDLGGCSALITLMESTDPEIHGGVVSYSSGSSSIILSFDEQIMVDKHIITYEFILPSALTEISDEAFSGGAFSSVVIPESVTKIGSRAFADCPNLQYVQILGPTIDIAPDAFENVDGLTVYYKFSSALTRVDAQALGCAFVQMP